MPTPHLEESGSRANAALTVTVESSRERDPFRFLRAHHGEARALLAGPGFVLAGVGVAAEARATGPERFRRIREAIQRAEQRFSLPDPRPEAPPQWLGGFAFDPDDDADASFPSARFILPRLLLRIEPDASYLTTVGTHPAPRPSPRHELGAAPSWDQSPDPQAWTLQVREALRDIQAGRLDKIVLARRLEAVTAQLPDPVTVAQRLRDAAPGSTTFLFEPEPGESWVGASPELLVRRSRGRVTTVALAGSRPRGATPAEDEAYERSLLASSKDAWEHELVCRSIRSVLEERGRPWQTRTDRDVLKLPHVQHLETRFESTTTPDEHVLDLAQRLHPTPAVCGSPREAARRLVARLEGVQRGWYAGAVGHVGSDGDGALHVGIRSARLRPASATLWAGCGIVNGSDPAEEWEESRNKFQTLLSALGANR